jgi:hypothetical protein
MRSVQGCATDTERLDALESLAQLSELIGQYWGIAYKEGEEKRSHDTKDGAAAKCHYEINRRLCAIRNELVNLRQAIDQSLLAKEWE